MKYAVLHLQAAVEVLFKARLLAEHWTLVFTHPVEATRKALDEATLSSVSPDKAITRLRNIVGVQISTKEEQALRKLTETRNKLQHFGVTDNARAVEARAGEVLDFLIRFIDAELQPYLEPEDREATKVVLKALRKGLGNINAYVEKRMNRIAGELREEGVERVTIECLACEQVTLVVGEAPPMRPADGGTFATCRFCASFFELNDLPITWLLHRGQNGDSYKLTCPWCHEGKLGNDVRVRSEPEPVYFCFACFRISKEIAPCHRCRRPVDVSAEDSAQLCRPCRDA
ncbi:serine/arginine repetitive matrix protein 1 [Streptomyces sp. NPDC059810]|uniref:serine/arginine repetitive matrix protein 1 n=1 Tax=Streptomyces sp. NPDC059810 TaxID=3346956 RepID=UPI00364BB347